jgi:hypothetical protein
VRASSAGAGVARLLDEAEGAGVRLVRSLDGRFAQAAETVRRAEIIARRYTQHWTATGGVGATAKRLEQIAVTESADAWGGARAKYLREQPALGLLRVWDARLDRRTCPTCSSLDGVIVGAREPFPHGEAPIHPWCRCNWTLLTPSEADGVTTYEPRRTSVEVPAAVKAKPAKVAAKPEVALVSVAEYKGKAKITREFVADDSPEARALSRYVGTSAPVNQYLRDRASGATLDEFAEEEVANIRAAMAEIRTRGGAVRGAVMRGETLDAERFSELSSADSLTYPNFVSTTISKREAAEFAGFGGRQALITIEDADGIVPGGLGSQGGSREVLLEPGKFRVLSRRVEGNKIFLRVTRK